MNKLKSMVKKYIDFTLIQRITEKIIFFFLSLLHIAIVLVILWDFIVPFHGVSFGVTMFTLIPSCVDNDCATLCWMTRIHKKMMRSQRVNFLKELILLALDRRNMIFFIICSKKRVNKI